MNNKAVWRIARLAACAGLLGAAYTLWARPRHLRWGATDEETIKPLPGDEIAPNAKSIATHAVTIDAPASEVWKWLVQIGRDKGGFYSYSWLENLAGCQLKNADRILPEFQILREGDEVWLHPKAPPLPVMLADLNRALVLGSNLRDPGTWGFYLEPLGEKSTRLIIRARGEWKSSFLRNVYQYGLFEPAHFIMERKMMLTLKHLAERSAGLQKRCRCGGCG